jgi:hypothetical protein
MTWPYTYNINYYYGDSFDLVLYPRENSAPYDLTGKTSLFSIATERGNPEAIVISASPQMSASPSRLICSISPEQGLALTGNSYVYDIEIRNGNEVYTLLTGDVAVEKDVTPNIP